MNLWIVKSIAVFACAIAAAQRGLRVCVLERKRDPGDKLRTTGIIVKEAAEQTLLNRLPAHLKRRRADPWEGIARLKQNLKRWARTSG